mgnify:CR=1 FL=1
MTVIARFELTTVGDESMTDEIAAALEALDEQDVSYELTPTDTVIEADDVHAAYEAAAAAHEAVQGVDSRVITSVEVDDQGGRERHAADRVEAVGQKLGRAPKG